jgi:hypothetical protein
MSKTGEKSNIGMLAPFTPMDRDSPDDSQTGREYWRFSGLPARQTAVQTASGTTAARMVVEGSDPAIFPGIRTHSSRRFPSTA